MWLRPQGRMYCHHSLVRVGRVMPLALIRCMLRRLGQPLLQSNVGLTLPPCYSRKKFPDAGLSGDKDLT
jgi:hypothetical protein